MEELPKIVQHRLAATVPGEHPDANLLAAFNENALATRERGEVLQHLAVCAECREITSLALPQEEAAFAAVAMAASAGGSAAVPLSAPRGFHLRWGGLAACAVIVAGVLWFTRRPTEKTVAVLPTGTISSSGARDQSVANNKAEPSFSPYVDKPAAAPQQARAAKNLAAKSRNEAHLPSKEIPANMAVASAPPPPLSALETSTVEATEIVALPAAPKAGAKNGVVIADAAAPAPARQKREVPLERMQEDKMQEKDKKSAVAGASFGGAQAGATLASTRMDTFIRWTLSDGQLRRSTDAGLTWEIVPVDPAGKFRSLSVFGEELWVGGKNGVLYHSPDNGTHWVHVIPSVGGESLTEDIVRLEFADADHGKLITPHSEWNTTNCGATWQKKPTQ